jgi:thiazole/oxazole-forming peptide maturase SagD family component
MNVFSTTHTAHPFGPKIEGLMARMLSPITGLDRSLGFSLHDRGTAGLFISIAQMAAVHRLLGWTKAPSYHLGGYGLTREESLIRALGETTERYAHMLCLTTGRHKSLFASASDLTSQGLRVMDFEGWNFFSEEQYATNRIRLQRFNPNATMTWLETEDLLGGDSVWLPAQILVLGYRMREGEPWLSAAFTTGTAAHTIPGRALNGAVLELLQMDAAMGAWYGGIPAPEIQLDDRLSDIRTIMEETRGTAYDVSFHWVRSADFDVHVVVCLLRSRGDALPAASVGISCEMVLQKACYKAFLEASSVPHLAQMGCLGDTRVLRNEKPLDPTTIGDLDANVLYYSLPQNRPTVDRLFPRDQRVHASDLPDDFQGDDADTTEQLLDRFRRNGMRLYHLDLTTPDVEDLGFVVRRIYSPDLLSLCLPSYPQAGHPRFKAYGGIKVVEPHPYP